MISFIDPAEQVTSWTGEIVSIHSQFTEAKILESLEKRFGELPSAEDIKAHCFGLRDESGTTTFIWSDKRPEMGEHIDLSNPLCVIAPPEFGGPMS